VKTCLYCRGPKPETEFAAHPKGRNGLHPWCNECRLAYGRAKYKGEAPPRADFGQRPKPIRPLREGEVMNVYMDFVVRYPDHEVKTWGPTQYLLRFGAAVSQATVKANE
jgi:hypothetical protein